ncbi:TPA: hypothetical protein N0F65_000042 [Lagenidium giganteum]|uniref:Uncharacterized protein n=1 Tax=Lagenidium giganteum TaxID=4803 RepID=A0AAV2YN27_9STRA|nr:TPA: hypothetical protein N0F65_000042 [Lagenidium giganteum]
MRHSREHFCANIPRNWLSAGSSARTMLLCGPARRMLSTRQLEFHRVPPTPLSSWAQMQSVMSPLLYKNLLAWIDDRSSMLGRPQNSWTQCVCFSKY